MSKKRTLFFFLRVNSKNNKFKNVLSFKRPVSAKSVILKPSTVRILIKVCIDIKELFSELAE